MATKLKILLFDIERAPSLGWVWGKYEQTVISFEMNWYMLCFSAKWLGDNKMITKALPDYPLYESDRENDKELIKDLWKLLDEADIVIAHNGDKFDIKQSNTKFLIHGLTPPSSYRSIDTLKLARRYFAFESARLDDLGASLGVGRKLPNEGFKLWKDCMTGDSKAWEKMKKYNIQDVKLLERVYLKLRPWAVTHPRVMPETTDRCIVCGSDALQRRGFSYSKINKYQRFQCTHCGAWTQGKIEKAKLNEVTTDERRNERRDEQKKGRRGH